MPLKKIKRAGKAVARGYKDYVGQKNASIKEATKAIKPSGSRDVDRNRIVRKAAQIRKAKGQSLAKAIKSRYKYGDIGR